MTRLLVWSLPILLGFTVGFSGEFMAQRASQKPPAWFDPNMDKDEQQIPPDSYCKKVGVPISPRETHAYPCSCTYKCTIDANGNVNETDGHRERKCKSYCQQGNRLCTCHVEEPCDVGHGQGVLNMHGHIVAIGK